MWKQTILSSLLLAPLALAKNECTIIPLGHGRSDTEQIVAAFEECGKGGIIDFPAPYVYTLGSKLLTAASDGAHVKIGGTLRFTDDIGMSFPSSFEGRKEKLTWYSILASEWEYFSDRTARAEECMALHR